MCLCLCHRTWTNLTITCSSPQKHWKLAKKPPPKRNNLVINLCKMNGAIIANEYAYRANYSSVHNWIDWLISREISAIIFSGHWIMSDFSPHHSILTPYYIWPAICKYRTWFDVCTVFGRYLPNHYNYGKRQVGTCTKIAHLIRSHDFTL